MPTTLQFRRGTTAQNNAFTGSAGEISVDTDLDTLVVHDGTTAGGHTLVTDTATQTLTNKTLTSPNITGLQLGGVAVTSTAAELSLLDGSTAGTVVNSKAVIYGASGEVDAASITKAGTNGVGNIGASGDTFNTVFAKATSAQYADLAERYATDVEYEPGTVVVIGGAKEVTACSSYADHKVLGIVSTDPAYKMNQSIEGQDIALTGRVPCKVMGPIERGDLLVTSTTTGHAEAWDPQNVVPGSVVGKALEAKTDSGPGVIEVAVGKV